MKVEFVVKNDFDIGPITESDSVINRLIAVGVIGKTRVQGIGILTLNDLAINGVNIGVGTAHYLNRIILKYRKSGKPSTYSKKGQVVECG